MSISLHSSGQSYREEKRAVTAILTVIWLILQFSPLAHTARAMENRNGRLDIYNDLMRQGKTDDACAILMTWQAENPDDPELLLTLCSYYVNRKCREFVLTSTDDGKDATMVLSGSTIDTGGSPTGHLIYDIPDVRTGLAHLERGLKKNPDRLDMRLEKIRILGEIRDLNRQKRAIADTLNRSRRNKNRWKGPGDIPLQGGRDIMLQGIQHRVSEYIRLMRYDYAKTISQQMIRLYPDVSFSYNNLGVIAYRQGKYDKALGHFRRAERINPGDCLVLNNIARVYQKQGRKKQALAYYRKLVKNGDEATRRSAEEAIRALTPPSDTDKKGTGKPGPP